VPKTAKRRGGKLVMVVARKKAPPKWVEIPSNSLFGIGLECEGRGSE